MNYEQMKARAKELIEEAVEAEEAEANKGRLDFEDRIALARVYLHPALALAEHCQTVVMSPSTFEESGGRTALEANAEEIASLVKRAMRRLDGFDDDGSARAAS
ncbi:MAG: hypothetical protein RLO50_14525 [Azospirillaceae bacterium]